MNLFYKFIKRYKIFKRNIFYINAIVVFLLFFISTHIGISQYYDNMRYDAVLPNYEYKKLNNQVLLFLNKQDTTNNLKKHIKPIYIVFPLIVIENHYDCDNHSIYYDILLYAKKTLQNKNTWHLLLFHKNKDDSVWRLGASSPNKIYTDNIDKLDNYMQLYRIPPNNNQTINFLTKQSNSLETDSLSDCRFNWKNIIHNSKESTGAIFKAFDNNIVFIRNIYVDTLNWKRMNGQNPSLTITD